MHNIRIMTSDPVAKRLLFYLAEQLPEPVENLVLLDAAWGERVGEFSDCKVILFTASADPQYLSAARMSVADGFWYMTPSVQELEKVLRGELSFPEAPPTVQLGKVEGSDLTARELEVLREIVEGKTDTQIGDALNIAVPTVKHHIQQLLSKTGFSNRTHLAVAAVSTGLIRPKQLQNCNNYTFV